MTKQQETIINATLKKQIETTFGLAISSLETKDEVLNFLKEFLTEKEFASLSKRFGILYWLSKKRNYDNIQNNLKASSSTIAHAKMMIKRKTIRNILKKVDADEWADEWSIKIRGFLKH